jgi:glutamine amidotransferase
MFLYDGDLKENNFSLVLKEFAKLAQNGCVPCGLVKGHLDGWGVHCLNKEQEISSRSLGEVDEDTLVAIASPKSGNYGQVLVHLRKASIGAVSIQNTHPFSRSGVSFCHNGSVKTFPETSFKKEKYLYEGATDSEIFFFRIMDRIEGKVEHASLEILGDALSGEVVEIQKTNDWTSLTCFVKSKDGVVLNYLWNENHPDSSSMEFAEYYTFFVGKNNDGATILCSEELDIDGFKWEKLKNGSLLSFPFKSS